MIGQPNGPLQKKEKQFKHLNMHSHLINMDLSKYIIIEDVYTFNTKHLHSLVQM
jgi:hypothetical protein